MNRPKIVDNLLGTGKPGDWNVPRWNRPAAQEFVRAEEAVQRALQRLVAIEAVLDKHERAAVGAEMGERYEPTDARRAKARFESSDWQQAWRDLLKAVEETKQYEAQWREEMAQHEQ